MFTDSALLYDLIYRGMKDYEAEASSILARIEALRPSARTVLSVACGTGEHERYLARRLQVDGIDLNPSFVEIAASKNPAGTYAVADMTDFDLGRSYDVVMCLFSSIGYVRTLENLRKTLACFARHLEAGGLLLVEPWFTPETWTAGRVHMTTVEDTGLKVCRMNISERRGERLSFFRFHYLLGRPEGVTHFTEDHELGLFTVEETKECLVEVGFDVEYDEIGLSGRGLYVGTATGAGRGHPPPRAH